MVSVGRGLGVASSFANQIRRVNVRGGDFSYTLGMGVPSHEEVEVTRLVHVALEEAIHHAFPQTRFEGPHLCLLRNSI